jgi:hypothetical protein
MMTRSNGVGFCWTIEEVRALITLTGASDRLALWGVEGFENSDGEGFDFGMRALMSRGLVIVEDGEVRVAQLAQDVVRCACSPDTAGLLFGSTPETYDIAAYASSGGLVLTCGFAANGVVTGSVVERDLVDHLMDLVRTAVISTSDIEWLLALRVQPIEGESIDILVGEGGLGVVEAGAIVRASEPRVRELLLERVG